MYHKVINCEAAKKLEAMAVTDNVLELMKYVFQIEWICDWSLPKKKFLDLFWRKDSLIKWGWQIEEKENDIVFTYIGSRDTKQIDYYEAMLISLIYTLIILNYAETDLRKIDLREKLDNEDDRQLIFSCFESLGYACDDLNVALRKEDL